MSDDTLEARFAARMGALLGPDFPSDIGLAVSGGGDSMAMLALSHGWARIMGVRLWVVTVDHGLRPESADEAAMVAAECAALGHPHATLRWHWDGQGNVQEAARLGRLQMIDRWRRGVEHVLMAHTQDDVAETFLMRLARGSGVEGLSAIAERRHVQPFAHAGKRGLAPDEVTQTAVPPTPTRRVAGVPAYSAAFEVLRPLLDESRAALRHHIKVLQVPYVDDPSNDDPRFDRVKARRVLAGLGALGLDATTLARTATRMRRARTALAARASSVAQQLVQVGRANDVPTGELLIARDGFAGVEADTQMRLLAAALQWVSGTAYRPRASALEDLLQRVLAGGGGTLQGCETRAERSHIRVFREFGALEAAAQTVAGSDFFDGRWVLSGERIAGATIRALGPDGWAQIPEKPEDAPPFHAARSLPAVFDGPRLIACRALDFGPDHHVSLRRGAASFTAFLESD